MENRSHALAAGLFVILLTLAVISVAVWFGGEAVKHDRYLLVSEVPVTGLNPQAAVRYRGVSVGKVEDIRLDPKNASIIFVRVAVDRDIPLTKNTYAQLGYQGLTGLAFIQLNDDGNSTQRLESSHDQQARIPMRPSALDNITNSGQHFLSNANELADRLNALLDDKNQSRISNILSNVEGASGHLDSIASQIQPGLKALPELAEEASVTLKRTSQLMTDLNLIVTKMNQQGGIIDSLSDTAEELSETLPKIRDASHGISRSARSADRVLLQLEEQPRSLLFGRVPTQPGPGENGFVTPQDLTK
ncbi:MAG: MlaD family protein [Nitrosomonadaceae bacterium]|nr:MlaD family protein [Nitrosomonadaceae bacterium]